jgi:hypothetical protein
MSLSPKLFFSQVRLAAQPELIFHIIKMSQDSSVSLYVIENMRVTFFEA